MQFTNGQSLYVALPILVILMDAALSAGWGVYKIAN